MDRSLQAAAERHAHRASAAAASWRTRWRPEPVAFFEHLPAVTVLRDR
ncbi:hypothetical protein [Streptomyces sp. NPDC005573]